MTASSDATESIRLERLDGFEFEELCKRVFEKLNLGKVTYVGHTGDEGRDLILEGYKGGRAIVECKHWPGSSIGRPIVQKLHSATISSSAHQALVVTTGPLLERRGRLREAVELKWNPDGIGRLADPQ